MADSYLANLLGYVKDKLQGYGHVTTEKFSLDQGIRLRAALALDAQASDLQQRVWALEVALGRDLQLDERRLVIMASRECGDSVSFYTKFGFSHVRITESLAQQQKTAAPIEKIQRGYQKRKAPKDDIARPKKYAPKNIVDVVIRPEDDSAYQSSANVGTYVEPQSKPTMPVKPTVARDQPSPDEAEVSYQQLYNVIDLLCRNKRRMTARELIAMKGYDNNYLDRVKRGEIFPVASLEYFADFLSVPVAKLRELLPDAVRNEKS